MVIEKNDHERSESKTNKNNKQRNVEENYKAMGLKDLQKAYEGCIFRRIECSNAIKLTKIIPRPWYCLYWKDNFIPLMLKYDLGHMDAAVRSTKAQSGRRIIDHLFEQLVPYIDNNVANVGF